MWAELREKASPTRRLLLLLLLLLRVPSDALRLLTLSQSRQLDETPARAPQVIQVSNDAT